MNTNDTQINLPASKSLSLRWLLLNHVCGGGIPIAGLSAADDVRTLRRILSDENAQCGEARGERHVDCGESGAVARFMLAWYATRPCGTVVLDGGGSLRQRPMAPLVKSLLGLGGSTIEYLGADGCLPLRVRGGLPEKKLAEIDPTLSGQYVSALALAGAATPRGLHIRMTAAPVSRAYIEMTCAVLRQAGADNDYAPQHTTIRVQPMSRRHFATPVQIERDWSAAAFFYMAAVFLPHRRLRLVGLTRQSLQGDREAAEIFKSLGVATSEARSPYRKTRSLLIEGGGELRKGLVHDFADCPDLVPPVAVACAAMGVEAWLSGVGALHFKECDRIEALVAELRKMGANVEMAKGKLHIAPSALHPTQPVHTYGDHRMAMAFGVLTLLFPDMQIGDRDVVAKSFPGFWQELEKLAQSVTITNH